LKLGALLATTGADEGLAEGEEVASGAVDGLDVFAMGDDDGAEDGDEVAMGDDDGAVDGDEVATGAVEGATLGVTVGTP
jgi:hypothetical protein